MPSPDVDAYIAAQPDDVARALEALRAAIQRAAPAAQERISYGVPTYHLRRGLVSFGVTKTGCSFYVRSPELMPSLKPYLEGVKVAGATVHFTPDDPLPEATVQRIVAARLAEVDPAGHP